jgi:hypothetical protein
MEPDIIRLGDSEALVPFLLLRLRTSLIQVISTAYVKLRTLIVVRSKTSASPVLTKKV